MSKGYDEQIEALQESLANDREELREAVARVKRAVSEPLDVPRRIRERPTPWVFEQRWSASGWAQGGRMNAASYAEDLEITGEPLSIPEGIPGREEIQQIDRRVRSFVSERPVMAVLLALTAGYVVGRIISRVS